MESLTVPLVAATVFTAGGYAIIRAERNAEVLGDWLFTVFIATVLVGCAILANQALERRRPAALAFQGSAAVPLAQAWTQIDVPSP